MSSSEYLDAPIVTDPDTLADAAFAYLQSKIPGWAPNSGNLDTIQLETMARMVAEARLVASSVPRSIFRFFGNSVLGIAPIANAYASADTTWTARDALGYTVAAGTQVGVRAAGDELIAFQVAFDVVIPPGSTTTTVGGVSLVASLPGEDANNHVGTMELIDPLDWVLSVEIVGQTEGGLTAESDEAYLNRLAAQLQLLSPRPILPDDFSLLALNIPGVSRALTLDGYNPDDNTFLNERMISIAVADSDGETVSASIKADVDELLQSEREINFIVRVIDPSYTLINVDVTYVTTPAADPVNVDPAVVAAIQAYLSPKTWGSPTFGESGVDSATWQNNPTVRYLELATVINNVDGVDYITALSLAQDGNALSTSDVGLTGVAAMPRANNITATGS